MLPRRYFRGPQKDSIDYPIFDFQKQIFDALENNMNIWCLKARGIGFTTFMIYYLTWKILSGSELDNQSVFIVSGTREAHANYIKEKLAGLFERNFPLLNLYTKYTEMVLKSTWIKVFPSTAVKDLRGYFSAKWIWCDESDFLNDTVQDELLAAITPYQIKSNAKIVLSSTANKPNSIMQRIELDPNSKYFKLRLPYQLGVSKIYDPKEIEKRKNDVEFKREFELQYLGKIGNVLTPKQVDKCIELGKKYSTEEIPVSLYTSKFIGLDWGFSSSATAIVAVEYMSKQYTEGIVSQEILRVVDCHLIEKGNPNDIVKICWDIYKKYGYMNTWYFCDAANAGMINLMKVQWDERTTWTKVEDVSLHSNKIIPVSFNANHKAMLSNLHLLVSKGYVAVDPKYDKLITAMRTAYAQELSLDKQQTSYDDLLDSLRLALFEVKIE